MAELMSAFVDPGATLDEIVMCLQDFTGTRFDRLDVDGKKLFRSGFLGLVVDVFDEHGLVDDCGIRFSRYPFEIDVEVGDERIREDAPSLARLVTLLLGSEISKRLSCETIVVEGHQTVTQAFG